MAGLDMAAGFSALKYGLFTILGMIPAIIMMIVGWLVAALLMGGGIESMVDGSGGGGIMVGLGMAMGLFISIVCFVQMMTFPVSMALADGSGNERMPYFATWKAATEMIIETIPVLGACLLALILGAVIGDAIGGLISLIGVLSLMLYQIGLIPYLVRAVAAKSA